MNPIEKAYRDGVAAGLRLVCAPAALAMVERGSVLEIDRQVIIHMMESPNMPHSEDIDTIKDLEKGDKVDEDQADAISRIVEVWR